MGVWGFSVFGLGLRVLGLGQVSTSLLFSAGYSLPAGEVGVTFAVLAVLGCFARF